MRKGNFYEKDIILDFSCHPNALDAEYDIILG